MSDRPEHQKYTDKQLQVRVADDPILRRMSPSAIRIVADQDRVRLSACSDDQLREVLRAGPLPSRVSLGLIDSLRERLLGLMADDPFVLPAERVGARKALAAIRGKGRHR